MPLHLGAFVLCNSKRFVSNFIHAIVGFRSHELYYQDTYSLYIKSKHWNELHMADLTGKGLLQGKNGYRGCGNFHGLCLAPNIKRCLIFDKFGNIDDTNFLKDLQMLVNL